MKKRHDARRHAAPSDDMFLVEGFVMVRRATISAALRERQTVWGEQAHRPVLRKSELELKREGE